MSVQRIVADLIPRYACHCPKALEAATKVVINMHNWSLALITKEEDSSGVAFETAKACIFGLADICCVASSVASTSAVTRGIRSAVFQNVLTFFIALFEGKDVSKMIDKNFLNMQDNPAVFSELKQKVLDEDNSSLTKLSKFHTLCILWVFFSCPKELLAACLELLGSATKEGTFKGQRFMSMVTSLLNDDESVHPLCGENDGPKSCTDSIGQGIKEIEVGEKVITDDNHISDTIQKSCLLMLVILFVCYLHTHTHAREHTYIPFIGFMYFIYFVMLAFFVITCMVSLSIVSFIIDLLLKLYLQLRRPCFCMG
jgi:activating signal cointegrator complex subunit 2